MGMLDQELFIALEILKSHENGGLCIVNPDKEGLQDRTFFDSLVQRAFHLRKLGYISFNDKQIIKDMGRAEFQYLALACEIEYPGSKALSFGSFSSYKSKCLESDSRSAVKIDQSLTIHGNVIDSNIASHSSSITQSSLSGELTKILSEIIEILKQDKILSSDERQEKIEDVEFLRKELTRSAPRADILKTICTGLENTASVASSVSQLWPYILPLLGGQ